MALRVQLIDLRGYDSTKPFKISLNCAYWSLRVHRVNGGGQTLNGVDLEALATGLDSTDNADTVAIDFPPVFDEMGTPVPFNQVLDFNPNGTGIRGAIVMTYWDPSLLPR